MLFGQQACCAVFYYPNYKHTSTQVYIHKWHSLPDLLLVHLHLVDVEEAGRGRVLGVLDLTGGAAVNVGLGHNGETAVDAGRLVDVKDKLRVLDDVDPEPQGKTGGTGREGEERNGNGGNRRKEKRDEKGGEGDALSEHNVRERRQKRKQRKQRKEWLERKWNREEGRSEGERDRGC